MTLGPVVGRDVELAQARRFLDSLALEPGALLVEGEAGIGKTTVWTAVIGEAESRGIRVLQARGAETEVQLSYATLADLVGGDFEETRRALPPIQQRALAAALLRAEADEPVQPRTIATALVGVLASLAEAAVILVAVDDVQWLDPASAGSLSFAARRLPDRVGLLLTRRGDPGEPRAAGSRARLAGASARAALAGATLARRAPPPDPGPRSALLRLAPHSRGSPRRREETRSSRSRSPARSSPTGAPSREEARCLCRETCRRSRASASTGCRRAAAREPRGGGAVPAHA